MKTKNTKRGFTIVELVIVIAVIAILAAVLIPTFTGIVRKARESSDVQLVRNLNTLLATDKADNTHETVADALEATRKAGFDIAKINAAAKGNEIMWDSVNDLFCYYDEDEGTINYIPEYEAVDPIAENELYLFWAISDAVSSTYSTYLNADYEGSKDITTFTGLDTGDAEGITSVTYDENGVGKNVTIITHSSNTDLVIDGETSEVEHFGPVGDLTITAVKNSSYYENGVVSGKAEIKAGRVVVANDGVIPAIKITGAAVTVETNKDIAVTVADNVATDAIKIKATAATVKVAVDETLATKVEGAASTTPIEKVGTAADLTDALAEEKPYIVLIADITTDELINITHSCVIDGNGYTISGKGGARGSNFTNIAINHTDGTEAMDAKVADKVAVEIRNLNIVNTCASRAGRVIETRGNLTSLTLTNVNASYGEGASYTKGRQILTIGGPVSDIAKVTVTNCDFNSGVGQSYAVMFYNPVDMTVIDSTITGWSTLYFKYPDDSAGSEGSNVVVKNSALISTNPCESGETNGFGCVVIEDNNVNVTLDSCTLAAYETGSPEQNVVLFSNYGAEVTNSKVTITGDTTEAFGGLFSHAYGADETSNKVVVNGGTFTKTDKDELVACVADGYAVVKKKGDYVVVAD